MIGGDAGRAAVDAALKAGRTGEAILLLRQRVAAAADPDPHRLALAKLLAREGELAEALAQVEAMAPVARHDNRAFHSGLLLKLGRHDEALPIYQSLAATRPRDPDFWHSYGALLRGLGRQDEAIAAYRRATGKPGDGPAWWGLANLKTFRFAPADLAAMRRALRRPGLDPHDAAALHFALGKAQADAGQHDAAFADYAAGNRLIAASFPPGAASVTTRVDQLITHFDAAAFGRLGGRGDPSPAPIFILGMHRAGSTLVEQILSSHPAIEGTAELPILPRLWRSLGPDPLAALDRADLAALGATYLTRAAAYRREGKPRFIDKLPDNWLHAAFIRLILPNAHIIDVRRHPMASGFSNFRQRFAGGAAFSYDLATIGRFYADYVRFMDHIDRVQPGAVHRLIYEQLVDDPEREIRRLLDFLGLPFDPACLNFHANTRTVATPSAQQVRRPINRDGLDAWRPFEAHLGPLREALDDALHTWDKPQPR